MNTPKFLEHNGWIWHHNTKNELTTYLANFAKTKSTELKLVKKNPVRSVWKLGSYYVKHNHPTSKFDKLRFSLHPKAMSEYKSLQLLISSGIKAVEPCAWAKCGAQSLLLTKELDKFENAHGYWFDNAYVDNDKKRNFLNTLASFVEKLVAKNIRHPDFHLGNLLFDEKKSAFAIVDAYKISIGKSHSNKANFEIFRIIASPKGEISDAEARTFLIQCGAAKNEKDADSLWTKILQADTPELAKKWSKVKPNLFSSGKTCAKYIIEGNSLLIRKNIFDCEIVDLHDIQYENSFEIRIEKLDKAKKIWENSFLLELYRIPAKLPVALKIPFKNLATQQAILFYKKEEKKEKKIPKQDIIRRCSIFRIPRKLTEQVITN